MFKKLLAVGLLATAVGAQAQTNVLASSNVQIGGRISQYFTNNSSAGSATARQIDSNTSNIFFRGSEDLGDGIKANFMIDTSIAADDPRAGSDTQLGDRQSTVGLSNKFGSIDMGRKDNAMFQYSKTRFDAFSELPLFSASNRTHAYRGNRIGNGIFLEAKPVEGVIVGYQAGLSENANREDTQVLYAVLNPVKDLHLGAFRWTTHGTDETTMLRAAYTLPTKTRVFAGYSQDKISNIDYKAWSMSALHPVTPKVDFKIGYGVKDVVDQKTSTVGFAYNFSRRTAVDIAYQNQDARSVANQAKRYGVGLTHRF
jgi:predicted porin